MKIFAAAKVNLTLEILGKRLDGYHELRSKVMRVEPLDELDVEESAEGISVTMIPNNPTLLECDNLVYRAAKALAKASGCMKGAKIIIHKRIPEGAGLGGGSADAAATLVALNVIWNLGLSNHELELIAAEVGSDVPALISGKSVLMEGRGEKISKLEEDIPNRDRFVLRLLPVKVNTATVYREFRQSDCGLFVNDLQPAACRLYPEIAQAIDAMKAEGFIDVSMSGSGSSIFGWRK